VTEIRRVQAPAAASRTASRHPGKGREGALCAASADRNTGQRGFAEVQD
jgi:hypothetical protein